MPHPIHRGVTSSYGTFQTFYETSLLPTTSPSTIAWIGSIQSFLVVIVGVIAGPLFDRGYLQHLIFLGCILIVFGTMMLSLANSFYQIFLTQGVCVGLGAGLIFIPALALISSQFTTKRPLALGLASSGSAVGMSYFQSLWTCQVGLISKAELHRWCHIPNHVPPTSASHWIPMDSPLPRLHKLWYSIPRPRDNSPARNPQALSTS